MEIISDKMLEIILNNLQTTVYAKDIDGRFLYVNPKWEDATGLKKSDVIGKTDYELLGFEMGEYYWSMDREVIEKNTNIEKEEIIERESNDITIISIRAPMTENGKIIGVCGIGTDISKIKLLQKNLTSERDKSDKLLLNVLPKSVADELKESGTTRPENFDNVAVLFSDIHDFTRISQNLKPEYLINELNDIFTEFDNNIENNQCERIKTIGDAYMAVCGLPEANDDYADLIVDAAVNIICSLKVRSKDSDINWMTTIGIDGGSVVGGVVGVKKYIYDIFGNTVNMAARLQSATKLYGVDILISNKIYDNMKASENHDIREIDIVRVKGEEEPIKLYEVFDCDDEELKEKKTMKLEQFNEARQCYIKGDFEKAMELFKECKEFSKEDKIYSTYVKRCNTMMRLPPNDLWCGISGI